MEKTPLEDWIRKKISSKQDILNNEQLQMYQLQALLKNIAYVKKNSPFYKKRLAHMRPDDIQCLKDLQKIPFTTSEDIKKYNLDMVCVSQNQINRIVTLETSGTIDLPKRIYFTLEDQGLTIDFFHMGMSTFTKPGQKVLVLLPGITPGSTSDLLQKALKRMNVETMVYGVVDDGEKVEQIIINENINGIVGIPQQVLALSKLPEAKVIREKGRLEHVLLSTDYVSDAVVNKIKDNWGCRVYEHYGMTEMGLGGGVSCQALRGYHLREADMIFEIVDAHTGLPVRDGEWGEVVFTTLTREAMPLIRYKTGDISRFIKAPCSCNAVLRTMDKVQYRLASSATLNEGYTLTMSELEEILFDIEGTMDFDAVLISQEGMDCLNIYVQMTGSINEKRILSAIKKSPLGSYVSSEKLKINIQQQQHKELDIKGIKKRKIIDKRRESKEG